MRDQLVVLVLLWSAIGAACGGGGETPSIAPSPGPEPAWPPVDPETAGTVRGRAVLEGHPPEPEVLRMGADPYCAQQHQTGVKAESIVVNEDGTLRNVFVYVKEGLESRKFTPPTEPVVLTQERCVYVPHVFGIMTGQPLEIVSEDATLHNIRANPEKNRPFNIGQTGRGSRKTRTFEVPEVMVAIHCDVHKWMRAYAGVLAHPYFDVTGDGGAFEIAGLPPGNYRIEAWHETFGALTRDVGLGEREALEVDFRFAVSR